MPVTSRLLRRLTETLGDDATSDLLVWFDEARTVNQAVVRDVAEAYFARFDARLEQRLAETAAMLRTEFRSEISRLEIGLASQRADLIKWMFVFWIGTIVPLAGLIIALDRL